MASREKRKRLPGIFLVRLAYLILFLAVAGILAASGLRPPGRSFAQTAERAEKLAPFVPTPMAVVEKMLEIAEVKSGDVVYDLGSGDGRIVIAAARRYGVRAVGFEIDPELVRLSRENARRAGVSHLVEFRQEDILKADLSQATVVTLYLFPEANRLLRPILWRQLKPGARIVSNDFDMDDWQADKVEAVQDPAEGLFYTLYLWRMDSRPTISPQGSNPG